MCIVFSVYLVFDLSLMNLCLYKCCKCGYCNCYCLNILYGTVLGILSYLHACVCYHCVYVFLLSIKGTRINLNELHTTHKLN